MKKTTKKKIWMGILAVALVFGMTFVGCEDESVDDPTDNNDGGSDGTFTLIDIPSDYNGKYAYLSGQIPISDHSAVGFGGFQSVVSMGDASSPSTLLTLCLISNGRVSIPLWTNNNGSIVRYSPNNATCIISVALYNTQTTTMDSSGLESSIGQINFASVAFSNGSAARSWNAGQQYSGESNNSGSGENISGTFNSISAMSEWLNGKPVNSVNTAYTIKLNVSSLGGSASTSGSVGNVLKANENKYVRLDLSGSTITNIDYGTFSSCTTLISITIPSSVKTIGAIAPFDDCTGLTEINVDTANTAYSSVDGVLYNKNKTSLMRYPAGKADVSFTIPSSVTTIGYGAFAKCTKLTSITIQNSVTSIEGQAFNGCTSLVSITIPSSVTIISDSLTFASCTSLTAINVDAANTAYSSVDGVLYNKNKTILVTYPKGKTGNSFIIPDSVTSIGNFAVYYTLLTSVTIPNGVTSIGNSAFSISNLNSVTIPSSVTSIGGGAFSTCLRLTSVTFLGTISSNGFNSSSPFDGDLRAKFYATNSTNGMPGTYTRTNGSSNTWTKQ